MWLAARKPDLPSNSHFGEIVRQLPTHGRVGFFWSSDSRTIYAEDPAIGAKTVRAYPIDNAHPSLKVTFTEAYANLIGVLTNGNILMSVQPSLYYTKNADRLLEVSPTSGARIVESPAPDLYFRPAALSHDGEYAFLDASPDSLTAYSMDAHAPRTFPLSHMVPDGANLHQFVLQVESSDTHASRMLISVHENALQSTAEAIVIWNYKEDRADVRVPIQGPEHQARLARALIDNSSGELVEAWEAYWSAPHTCRLQRYDLTTGRAVGSHEDHGEAASLSASPDELYLTYSCGQQLQILNMKDPQQVLETITAPQDYEFTKVSFSPDSRYLAVEIDNVVTVLSVRSENVGTAPAEGGDK